MNLRKIIHSCLCDIMIDHTYSNLCLRKALQPIDPQHRPYITQCVYGTLENYRYVRWCWEDLVKKEPQIKTCVLLDMAVLELLWMKTPAYAVLSESVRLMKQIAPHQAGLVNAVLRNVVKRGKRPLPSDPNEALSIETSHPLWLIKMWNAQYGTEIARTICQENLKPRKLVARINSIQTTKEALLSQEPCFLPSKHVPSALIYTGGNIAQTTWYQNGDVSIQDEASQMIAPLLEPKVNQRILDVCSAPGTKACHIAELIKDQGEILCIDLHEHRVDLIKEGAKRLHLHAIQAQCMDATKLDGIPQESFDRVLCDVPCTGYGTLSRKSDIKLHMEPTDMDTLIPLQRKILHEASTKVKPSGILVYSTCTLNKKENEKQLEWFLKTHEEFQCIKEQTIFPFQYDCDGFYMAKLSKR